MTSANALGMVRCGWYARSNSVINSAAWGCAPSSERNNANAFYDAMTEHTWCATEIRDAAASSISSANRSSPPSARGMMQWSISGMLMVFRS